MASLSCSAWRPNWAESRVSDSRAVQRLRVRITLGARHGFVQAGQSSRRRSSADTLASSRAAMLSLRAARPEQRRLAAAASAPATLVESGSGVALRVAGSIAGGSQSRQAQPASLPNGNVSRLMPAASHTTFTRATPATWLNWLSLRRAPGSMPAATAQ